MPRLAVAVAAAVIVFGGALLLVPPLTREVHGVDATPSPPPLARVALVSVPRGGTACVANVVFDAGSQVARFRVGTYRRPGPPLEVTAAGRRYRVAAGYPDNAELAVGLRPPRRPVAGSLCIADRGRRPNALYGSDELRTRSRVVVTVDGRLVGADATLRLERRRPRSVLDELGDVIDHTTRWRPGVSPWFAWLLLGTVLVGVPGGVLWALGRAMAEDAIEPAARAHGPGVSHDSAP